MAIITLNNGKKMPIAALKEHDRRKRWCRDNGIDPNEYRPIPGFGGYKINPWGKIQNPQGMPMRTTSKPMGYTLWRYKGKHVMVHRLVARTYLPNPDELPVVHHKNHRKHDNFVENLEWTTHAGNMQAEVDAGRTTGRKRLTADEVRAIRKAVGAVHTIAGRFGVSKSTVSNIRSGKSYTHVI